MEAIAIFHDWIQTPRTHTHTHLEWKFVEGGFYESDGSKTENCVPSSEAGALSFKSFARQWKYGTAPRRDSILSLLLCTSMSGARHLCCARHCRCRRWFTLKSSRWPCPAAQPKILISYNSKIISRLKFIWWSVYMNEIVMMIVVVAIWQRLNDLRRALTSEMKIILLSRNSFPRKVRKSIAAISWLGLLAARIPARTTARYHQWYRHRTAYSIRTHDSPFSSFSPPTHPLFVLFRQLPFAFPHRFAHRTYVWKFFDIGRWNVVFFLSSRCGGIESLSISRTNCWDLHWAQFVRRFIFFLFLFLSLSLLPPSFAVSLSLATYLRLR